MILTPTVFLDRDGVIVYDGDYVFDPAQIDLIPGAAHAIAELRDRGLLVVCVTNQSGVEREKPGASIWAVDACNRRMQELLYAENPAGSFLDIRYAPQADTSSPFRKPGTALIEPIQPWVDTTRSFFVGDREGDLACGLNLGLPKEHCIKVASPHFAAPPGFTEVLDIQAAKDEILRLYSRLAGVTPP